MRPPALLALAWLPLLAGCHALPALAPPLGEHQACAERGLVGMHDPVVLADARARFEAGCDAGDAASCSALGRMFELGSGLALDPARALSLFRRACDAGNALGCANLWGLASSGPRRTVSALTPPGSSP